MGVFIIAEAGVNHNGSLENALKMVDTAKECGADAVKFQTFITEEGITKNSKKAAYQKENTGSDESQFEMIKKLELSYDDFRIIAEHCRKAGIEFMSSPFDIKSAEFLNTLGCETFKIPSGEIVHLRYLQKLASFNKKYIISTGMCNEDEISDALEVFYKACVPKSNIVILHANTQYPTPIEDVNLNAMTALGCRLGLKYGYSDHTPGLEVPVAATAMGASVIEKHFTLDKSMPGPDHAASLSPQELKAMTDAIRNTEKAMGSSIKTPSKSEIENIEIARKSLVAKRAIKKGEILSDENITAKRPGTGISPMKIDEIIGKKAEKDYAEDELI